MTFLCLLGVFVSSRPAQAVLILSGCGPLFDLLLTIYWLDYFTNLKSRCNL